MSKQEELDKLIELYEQQLKKKETIIQVYVLKKNLQNDLIDLLDYSDKDILKNFSSYIFEPEKQKSRTVILNHVHAGTQKATNDEAEGDFATKKAFIDAAELDNKKKTKQNQNHFKILEDCFDKMPSVDGKLTHSMKTKCNENTRFISGLRNKNHEKENKDDTVKISTQKGDGFDLFLSLSGSKSKSKIYEKCRVIFRNSPSNFSFDNTLVLMPDDDNNYQKQIDELLNFLSKSHNCFFNAEMPQGMRLKQVRAHEPYYLKPTFLLVARKSVSESV